MSYFEAKTEYERDLENHPDSMTAWLSNTLGKKAYGGHYFRKGELIVLVVPDQDASLGAAKEAVSSPIKRNYPFHVEEGKYSRAALERAKELVILKLARSSLRNIVAVHLIQNTVQVCIPDDPASQQEAEQLGLFDDPLLTILRMDWDAYEQRRTRKVMTPRRR